MPEIREALVTVYAKQEQLDRVFEVLKPAKVNYVMPYAPGAKERIAEAVKTADVAILNGDLDDSILAGKNLKWIHCCHAGLDRSARPEVFERGIILTSSSGRSAPALAQHALLFIEALTYDLPMLFKAQKDHRWAASREYSQKTGIIGKTIGIIGLGKNGSEMARLAKTFDMKVLGWDRRRGEKPNVDEIYGSEDGDDLNTLLARCDYVTLCVELNDKTYHMIGAEQFKAMKNTAFLINMGRGKLIDEPAMVEALKAGEIGGAGLDTFEVEPLPQDSPLWDMDNVIITPHCTPAMLDREERMLDYAIQNIHAYRGDGNFVNRITEKSIYSGERYAAKY
ncbi:MAG: D-2-hydroxyacid dehydrogenase [Clostridia bacterium]|nr:D-2-hydroxyacid dehydrogenase [Clostridia bacterium]